MDNTASTDKEQTEGQLATRWGATLRSKRLEHNSEHYTLQRDVTILKAGG